MSQHTNPKSVITTLLWYLIFLSACLLNPWKLWYCVGAVKQLKCNKMCALLMLQFLFLHPRIPDIGETEFNILCCIKLLESPMKGQRTGVNIHQHFESILFGKGRYRPCTLTPEETSLLFSGSHRKQHLKQSFPLWAAQDRLCPGRWAEVTLGNAAGVYQSMSRHTSTEERELVFVYSISFT